MLAQLLTNHWHSKSVLFDRHGGIIGVIQVALHAYIALVVGGPCVNYTT